MVFYIEVTLGALSPNGMIMIGLETPTTHNSSTDLSQSHGLDAATNVSQEFLFQIPNYFLHFVWCDLATISPKDLLCPQSCTTILLCDNQNCVSIVWNPVLHGQASNN